jgi:hypothetical protein
VAIPQRSLLTGNLIGSSDVTATIEQLVAHAGAGVDVL